MASIRRQQAAKRLKAALNRLYEPQANTVQAGPVGDNQLYAAGQIYTGGVTGVTEVVNIGRPAAAVYVAKGSGGTTVVANRGSTSSGGGGGDGLPTDGSGAMTGDLNMGGNDITNVATVDGVDISVFYSDYTSHHHDDRYVNVTGDNMTGALTINSNTVWHAGNDGAGSGLDADLWDGNQFASYLNQPVRTTDAVQFLSVTTPTVTSVSTLTLSPTTDIILDPTGDDVILNPSTRIGTNNFVSGSTGWRISYDGSADFRDIFADTLTVETFISDVNLALAGSQIIVKSLGILAENFSVPSVSDTLDIFDLPGFNDSQNFENGDWVRLRYVERGTGLVVGDAWGTVSSYTDADDGRQTWTWTRQSGTVGKTIYGGMVALDYGQSGDGYIHLTTLQNDSPYLDVATWVTNPSVPANHTVHVRLGNLDGISASGLNPGGWGLYSDNVFLEGNLLAGGGDVYVGETGINIQTPTGTPSTSVFSDKLTFTTVPNAPERINTAGQIYAQKYTSGTPTFNQMILDVKAGDNDNADIAYLDITTSVPFTGNIAKVELTSDSDTGASRVDITAQNTGDRGNIHMIGYTVFYEAMTPQTAGMQDIGTAGKPFGTIYADHIVYDSVSGNGDTMIGDIWQHDASDMYIRSSSAANRTLYVANPSTGTMHLDVEGNITVGGTVDGVDIAALASSVTGHNHDDRYYTETEADARFVRGVSGTGAISVTGSLANYTVAHSDTSAIGPTNSNPGLPLMVAGLQIDDYGHVTTIHYSSLDNRYYTETESDARFAPISHNHNTIYYTKGEVDDLLDGVIGGGGEITGDLTLSGILEMGSPATTVIDANRRFYLADGTAALPGLSFSADTNTGLYRVGADSLGISTNGVQRVGITDTSTTILGDLFVGEDISTDNTITGGTLEADTRVVSPKIAFDDAETSRIYTLTPGVTVISNSGYSAIFSTTQNVLYRDTTIVDLTAQSATMISTSFEPATEGPPFSLSVNGQGQTVTGLKADQLNKSVTAGDGLSGGGAMTANVTMTVDSTVARRNAINNFEAAYQQITAVAPALYLTNTTPVTWGMVNLNTALLFIYEGVSKFSVTSSGNISIAGNLTVDGDTLSANATHDAVWINSGTPDGSATFKLTGLNADDITSLTKAAPSQSAYIWRVEDSAGSGLLGIDAVGNLQSLSTGFVSGRSGWRITPDGNAEFNNLVARGEIRTAVFVKDEIAVDSGSHLFAEGALTLTAFTSGSGTLTLNIKDPPYEHARIFDVGDNLIMRSGGVRDYNQSTGPNINEPWNFFAPRPANAGSVLVATQVYLTVTGYTDEGTYYSYEVVKQSGPVVTFPENTTVVSYGQGTTGLMGVFADQGFGPYLDVFLPGATPWAVNPVTTLRLGRLDGLGLPELADEQYGLAVGTDLSDESARRLIASDQQFTMYNIDLSISNSDGIGIQFALDQNSYFGGFHFDYDNSVAALGRVVGGELANEQTNIQLYLGDVDHTDTANIYLRGEFRFERTSLTEAGHVWSVLPFEFYRDGNSAVGWSVSPLFGSWVDMASPSIKCWSDSSNYLRMAGFVDGAESWSVNQAGVWTFSSGEVQINGGGIRIAASDLFDDVEDRNQLYWLDDDGTQVAGVFGFTTETLSRGITINATSSESTATASLVAETPESAGNITISALLNGTSQINLSSNEVFAAGAIRIGGRLILQPISTPAVHATGATIYVDSADGDAKILFANGTLKTWATN